MGAPPENKNNVKSGVRMVHERLVHFLHEVTLDQMIPEPVASE